MLLVAIPIVIETQISLVARGVFKILELAYKEFNFWTPK
jgi:hypothetical protein